MFTTIPNTPRISKINYAPEFSAICSIGRAPFYGVVEIDYEPDSHLVEFESFEAWLNTLALQEMTIEDLARLIFDELTNAVGHVPLIVAINAETTVHAPVKAIIKRE